MGVNLLKNEDGKFIIIKSSTSINLNKLELDMFLYAKRKYSDIRSRVRRKKFDEIEFTLAEFILWIMNHRNYKSIYLNYINNKKDRNMCPSIDRLDDYKTYSIDNIRLVTWKENNDKYNSDRLIGKNTKQSKPVISICISTGEQTRYHSAHYAAQITGVERTSINRSCRKNASNPIVKSRTGNFIWIFESND